MEQPVTFLGLPVHQEIGNHWTAKSDDDRVTVVIYRFAEEYSIPSLWFRVYLQVKGVGVEEVDGQSLEDIEAYLRGWISNFKEAAKTINSVWPD